jgi:cytosine/adenosine deaminase-related metal-dependent hydrolase
MHGSQVAGGPCIDFDDAIAFPGLINSHDHLEFNVYPALGHRHYSDYREWGDDIHRSDRGVIASSQRMPKQHRLRWGALKNLLCGVTTVAHHGARRDDVRSLPIGAVRSTSIHSVRAPLWRWHLIGPPIRPPYVFHVAEGTSPEARREVDALIRWNVFGKALVAVHAIAMNAAQAAHFHAVVWCPVSNEFLYGTTADVASLKQTTTILFGTDSTLSAAWDVWSHLRRARTLHVLDDRELFAAVTRDAALAWGRRDTGHIAPGHTADLVIARKKASDPWDAFFAVTPEDLLLVLKDGQVVLRDPSVAGDRDHAHGSTIELGSTEKWVAEDVPDLLACLRHHGIASNLPIAARSGPDGPSTSGRPMARS